MTLIFLLNLIDNFMIVNVNKTNEIAFYRHLARSSLPLRSSCYNRYWANGLS